MVGRLSKAFLILTAPIAGIAVVWGGSILATVLWGLAAFDLDRAQHGYSLAFAVIGGVPFGLSVLWLAGAFRWLQLRSVSAVATAFLFLTGAAFCAWWVANPTRFT